MATKSCIHCGRSFAKGLGTRDHVPSRLFLRRPFPDNVATIAICADCNRGFSRDEEYFAAFLGMMLTSEKGGERHWNEASIESNWVLQEQFEASIGIEQHGDRLKCFVEPDQSRLDAVIAKNARGHWHIADGKVTRPYPLTVLCIPLANLPDSVLKQVVPLRDEWVVSQSGCYRFHLQVAERTIVRSVISEYLYTETHLVDASSKLTPSYD